MSNAELIAEARGLALKARFEWSVKDSRTINHLADALEAAEWEAEGCRTEFVLAKQRASARFSAYQQKERELRRVEVERDVALAKLEAAEATLQRMRAVRLGEESNR